jgi:hypothetical protein
MNSRRTTRFPPARLLAFAIAHLTLVGLVAGCSGAQTSMTTAAGGATANYGGAVAADQPRSLPNTILLSGLGLGFHGSFDPANPAFARGRGESNARDPEPAARNAQGAPAGRTPGGATSTATGSANPPAPTLEPILVYTGSFALVVNDVPDAITQVIALATGSGGYLGRREDTLVQVRVPSARFREVVARVERLGDVTHREVSVEDVSEQYHDLEVQLANLRAVRQRLQEFLNRAANVQDALAVERELERVAGQIDRIEGQLRFLASRAAFSTITVNLTPRPTAGTLQPQRYGTPELVLPYPWLGELGLPRLLETR